MSHGRENSVTDKVTGKKWVYLVRNTLHRWSVAISESTRVWVISFYRGGEEYSSYVREGVGISKNWATTYYLTFYGGLGTVMTPVGVSFSILMCYNECILRLKV